jgi:hypothetical protein
LHTIPDHCAEWTNCHSVYIRYLIILWNEQTVTQFIYIYPWSLCGMNKLSLSLYAIPDHFVEWTNCHSVYIPYLILVWYEQTVTQFIYIYPWSLCGMNKLSLSLYTIPDHFVEWTNCHSVYIPYLILVWYEQTVTQFIYHTWSLCGMNKLSLSLHTIPDHFVEWTNCHPVYIYHTWSLWGMNKLSLSLYIPYLIIVRNEQTVTQFIYTIPDHCGEWTNCHSVYIYHTWSLCGMNKLSLSLYIPYLIIVGNEQTVTQFIHIYHTWSLWGMNKLSLSLYIPYLIILWNEQTVTQFIYTIPDHCGEWTSCHSPPKLQHLLQL